MRPSGKSESADRVTEGGGEVPEDVFSWKSRAVA
jgi:hypothetical protein